MNNVIKMISTHKATIENGVINIYINGFEVDDLKWEDELIATLQLEQEDDLYAMFERFAEQNRINLAEANNEFNQ